MFTQYVDAVMKKRARYELLKDSKQYYGRITGFKGVWAQGKTQKACERNLREVLEEWLVLKIRKQQFVPTVQKYDLNALLGA